MEEETRRDHIQNPRENLDTNRKDQKEIRWKYN